MSSISSSSSYPRLCLHRPLYHSFSFIFFFSKTSGTNLEVSQVSFLVEPKKKKHILETTRLRQRGCSRLVSIHLWPQQIMFSSTMLVLSLSMAALVMTATAGNFLQDVDITWGGPRAKIFDGGRHLTLSLDKDSGSGFQSKKEYLFGRFDVKIKLVPGNSAGTVTTFYLSSQGPGHDEIDFEFLGNSSGDPYTLHTNVFSQGKGNREQQFHLWFDPTKAFHTYSIDWTPQSIKFLVDNIPIRVFRNWEAIGIPYPKGQPMRVYSSLWNADDWATRGGLVKTDWTHAPFTASYSNININACAAGSSCDSKFTTSMQSGTQNDQGLDAKSRNRVRWVQTKYMIYNYCTDFKRFPQGVPAECKRTRFL